MRLLFVSTYPHLPEIIGGLQTTTHDLCLALQDIGASVAVLCGLREHSRDGGDLRPQRDDALGYTVIRVPDPDQALALVAASWEPTAIIVQSGTALLPTIIAALETGRPTAVYLHNVEMHQLAGTLYPDPALLYLSNSQFTADRWRALCGIDSLVVPPVVAPERYLVRETGEKILFVNPTPIKGMEIMFGLAAACPDLPFLVAESWHLEPRWRAYCQRRAEALGNITWVTPTRDMRTLYTQARLLLMPSLWEEAFGRTVIEAQLNGIPVLASDRGALPETVGEGGILVDAHAPLAVWEAALRHLYGADHADCAARARQKAFAETAATPLIAGNLLSHLAVHAER
ncbi:glycosyltransferase [Elstera litoralis]|uniref:glycosyltransferase n=1 Tax=Elstera litoralis TaxID=552518 RepID=UPI0006962FD1|nr:glycosyltransferase [Elstera litoralis]